MFVCQVSGKLSSPGEKMNKIIAVKRERVYTEMRRDSETGIVEEVEVGRGWEIVKEIAATAEGLVEWNNMSDSQRSEHLRHI